jgi:hypothetical protein
MSSEPAQLSPSADARRGWEARPVAIPDDVDDPGLEKVSHIPVNERRLR